MQGSNALSAAAWTRWTLSKAGHAAGKRVEVLSTL